MSESKLPFERLPANVKPINYELKLNQIDLEKFTFAGEIAVSINITAPTPTITLNSVDLVIASAQLIYADNRQVASTNIAYQPDQEIAEITFADNLQVCDNAQLLMKFTGYLNDKMKGFYRSKYYDLSGNERFGAVTQFEATNARRCFPCWDEPAIKATFDVTMVIPKELVGLSNMPVKETQELDGGMKLLKFERSPIMSTYLLAMVVGAYDYVEAKSDDGVLVRVYTPVGKGEQGMFALDVTVKVLPYYKNYFGIGFPLPKIDLIAISDFSLGAMENWGLVTYREARLLVDQNNTSLIHKQNIALTVGHELAHMWFGNLVTMEWWTELWLNEGYASFVEFLCVDHIFPHWDIWTQFLTDAYTPALEADCLDNSHSIEVKVGHPSEIDEIFDNISYNKGACVIRMLHHYLGDDDFKKGMNIYLTKYQYRNSTTEGLWESLEQASKKPVGEIMRNWTKKMGFPVVQVVENVQEANGRRLKLQQKKFTADGKIGNKDIWQIPINISTKSSAKAFNCVMKEETMEVFINIAADDYVKINPGSFGFYRTQYDKKMLESFVTSIKDLTLPPIDRLGLHDDLFALVMNGSCSTVDSLKLIGAYKNETNYTVWMSIASSMSKLGSILSHTNLSEKFNVFSRQVFTPIAEKLGWDAKSDESHLNTMLRALVLRKLIAADCEKTCEEAKKRFKLHIAGTAILPADLRTPCYLAQLKNATQAEFDELLNIYRTVDLHEEKDRIGRALGYTRNADLLRQVIDFAMSSEVRAQDAIFILASVGINPRGRDICWEFFKGNWKKLFERYEGGFLLSRLVKYSTENFATVEKANEIEQFFKTNEIAGIERTVQQSLETIKLNLAWIERDLAGLTEFFKEY